MRSPSSPPSVRRGRVSSVEMPRPGNTGRSLATWVIASVCFSWGVQECLGQLELLAASRAGERTFPQWEQALEDMENSFLQIDFSRSLADLPLHSLRRSVNATLGETHVICALPEPDQDAFMWQPHPTAHNPLTPNSEPARLSIVYPELRDHLRTARLRWLVDRCFQFKEEQDSEWTYEVCIGKKVTQFAGSHKAGKTIGKTLFEWGSYKIGHDQLWANGTLTQSYAHGTGGRHTELTLECLDQYPTVTGIEAVGDLDLRMWLGAPMFCDFRPSNPTPPLLETLLRPLEGWCANFTTSGWWSYEYCHPDSLVQFHKEASGEVKDPMYLLGTLHSSIPSANHFLTRPSADFPVLRGKGASGVNTRGPPKFRFLPVELADYPVEVRSSWPQQVLAMHLSNKPDLSSAETCINIHVGRQNDEAFTGAVDSDISGHLELIFQMAQGTRCEGTNMQRSARVLFECPDDFATLATHQVMRVTERSVCEFELLIHTPLVCPHPQLIPPRPKEPREVACVPAPAFERGVSPHPPETAEAAPHTSVAVRADSEAVPAEYLPRSKDKFDGLLFGTRPYTRSRESWSNPRFKIGNVVRHRWWGYSGVVLSWDPTCEAPNDWTMRLDGFYPKSHMNGPHYLLLVNQADSGPNTPTYAYVPEIALERASAHQANVRHPDLSRYFHHFSNQSGRYIPVAKSALLDMFPGDFRKREFTEANK